MVRNRSLSVAGNPEVVVLSADGAVRREVSAAVRRRPGARVQLFKADHRDPAIVYLATHHSPALEGAVRRAGASFYAVKAAREDDLTRVIEVLLARPND